MHVSCSPRLAGELLCAPKQLTHYHSPDDLSWDEWRLSDSEVERIDLENAVSPEEADELEEMTADEMAVDGYYVVAGIARHEYKQGWKFLTLWDGYGLSEATWETMSAFIQPDGSINPIFRTYLVENNEGQLLTRAETMSQGKVYLPSLGTSEPTVRTPDWSRPMGFYPSLQGLPYPYVCYVCLCVSHFSPQRGSRRPGFADVGPKVLIRYYYHSYGAQFLCWRLSLG